MIPWNDWEPIYELILADFDFDRSADEAARDELANLLGGAGLTPEDLPDATGQTVAIGGAASRLERDLDLAREADLVISASAATSLIRAYGIAVDVHVTDLDKTPMTAKSLTDGGIPVATHAHGDNRELLATHVPDMAAEMVLPTTQAAQQPGIYNVGGFTDGDRAAYLAHALGADRLVFPGWNFDDETVSPVKQQKLGWAERLLYWLERRRGDRFDLLDGRRDDIDLEGFPRA